MGPLSDAQYEMQKQRIRDLADRWVQPLGLNWGLIKLAFCRTRDEFDDSDTQGASSGSAPLAKCRSDWRYAQSTITWVLPEVAELDDDELETSFVHELMHIFLNEMREEGIDHEERVATTLAKAFIWHRDQLCPAKDDSDEKAVAESDYIVIATTPNGTSSVECTSTDVPLVRAVRPITT